MYTEEWSECTVRNGVSVQWEMQSDTTALVFKFHHITGNEGPELEYKCSCTFSLTSALDVFGLSTPSGGHFTPGKYNWYPLYRRLVGLQGR